MIVRESLFEFERGQDSYKNLDIGTIQKIKKDLLDIGIDPEKVEILPDFTIKIKEYIESWKGTSVLEIQHKYFSKEKNEFLKKIGDNKLNTKEIIDEAIQNGLSLNEIKNIINAWGQDIHKKKAPIYLSKIERTKEEEIFDEENNIYVFIGFTDKIPVEINGKKYYEDKFNTETVIKIDKFNTRDLMQIPMMKIRAKSQYPDGSVYMIHIPKEWMDEDRYEKIPEEFYEIIVEHKKKI
ncbi:MAG: hypothetical protein PHF86_01545 [Candidatus Nanoarchaeia archaeon]|nr:hypothetical protein [Candidatus Nanoarchaeia archaeon]